MKNSLFLAAIAVIVVVIAGGLWFFFAPVSPVEQMPAPYNSSQAPLPEPAPALSPSESVSIIIRSFAFEPGDVTIKKGTTIAWTNRDSINHTVTSDNGGALNSPVLNQGQNFSFTFTSPGEFNYYCSIHPSMKGKVTVTE